MLKACLSQSTKAHHQLRWLLVFVLLFAALHVALHDLDLGHANTEHQGECQVCRLNHVPLASLPVPTLHAPLQILIYSQPVINTAYLFSSPSYSRQARAPPLF